MIFLSSILIPFVYLEIGPSINSFFLGEPPELYSQLVHFLNSPAVFPYEVLIFWSLAAFFPPGVLKPSATSPLKQVSTCWELNWCSPWTCLFCWVLLANFSLKKRLVLWEVFLLSVFSFLSESLLLLLIHQLFAFHFIFNCSWNILCWVQEYFFGKTGCI